MNKDELYKSVELNELIRAYKAILRIKVAFIKYAFTPDKVDEDALLNDDSYDYQALVGMCVSMNDLLCDINDICEESSVDERG